MESALLWAIAVALCPTISSRQDCLHPGCSAEWALKSMKAYIVAYHRLVAVPDRVLHQGEGMDCAPIRIEAPGHVGGTHLSLQSELESSALGTLKAPGGEVMRQLRLLQQAWQAVVSQVSSWLLQMSCLQAASSQLVGHTTANQEIVQTRDLKPAGYGAEPRGGGQCTVKAVRLSCVMPGSSAPW